MKVSFYEPCVPPTYLQGPIYWIVSIWSQESHIFLYTGEGATARNICVKVSCHGSSLVAGVQILSRKKKWHQVSHFLPKPQVVWTGSYLAKYCWRETFPLVLPFSGSIRSYYTPEKAHTLDLLQERCEHGLGPGSPEVSICHQPGSWWGTGECWSPHSPEATTRVCMWASMKLYNSKLRHQVKKWWFLCFWDTFPHMVGFFWVLTLPGLHHISSFLIFRHTKKQ